jgi:hypothetical protein
VFHGLFQASSGMTVEWRADRLSRVPCTASFSDHGTQRRKLSKVYEMEMLVLTEIDIGSRACYVMTFTVSNAERLEHLAVWRC